MRRRIVIEIDDADKRATDKLVDRIYDLLQGEGFDYSVWVESFKKLTGN